MIIGALPFAWNHFLEKRSSSAERDLRDHVA
jgi:hypothetical protein